MDTRLDTSKISKTTVNGVLAGLITFATALLPSYPKYAAPALIILGAARVAVGVAQKDADLQDAIPAGKTDVEKVPAHPQPDNPNDIAVTK